MADNAPQALARRYEEEHPRDGYEALTDEMYAPDAAIYVASPGFPQPMDREGWKQAIGMFRAALPDIYHNVEAVVADGDHVAVRWSGGGTHLGPLMGMPPSGKQGTTTGMTIYRFAEGRIVESHHVFDFLGFLQQIGAIPSPG